MLNRIVLGGAFLFMVVYLFIRFTGGSSEKLQDLPDLISRIKEPIVCQVGGVKYLNFFQGEPEQGHKFVLVQLRLEARMKIAFPVVPKCFRLVDDQNTRYFPFSHSPLFIEHSNEIQLEEGTVLEGELLFEIPAERESVRMLFERYQE